MYIIIFIKKINAKKINMSFVKKIILKNFRSYGDFSMDVSGYKNIVIYGSNGVGKTNILEALSLLNSGSGLRRAKIKDFQNKACEDTWSVFVSLTNESGDDFKMATGANPKNKSLSNSSLSSQSGRKIFVDGVALKSQYEAENYFKMLYLVPWMDRVFVEQGSERRVFFDNFISLFVRNYSDNLSKYSSLIKQRSSLLKKKSPDLLWVDVLEKQIAELALIIASDRLEYVARLNKLLDVGGENFPKIRIELSGLIEDCLMEVSALEAEEMYLSKLKENRDLFKDISSPFVPGVHRSNFSAFNLDKNIDVDLTSTGEQKLSVISLLIQNIYLLKDFYNQLPVVLIDEAIAHLDVDYREKFFKEIDSLGCQVFYTGVEKDAFNFIKKDKTLFFNCV